MRVVDEPRAVFVGLCTLDVVYGVEALPGVNEKIVARGQEVSAGGPAANAAVTLAFLGGRAVLQAAVGRHAAAGMIREDLAAHGVRLVDLAPEFVEAPAISSVMVLGGTGERSVVSANATRLPSGVERLDLEAISKAGLLLVDGHNIKACVAAARQARGCGVATVLDGGSWKAGMEELLPWIEIAVCSADFKMQGALREAGVRLIAVTRGAEAVSAFEGEAVFEVAVPATRVLDTLGAGDVFHGAFCHAWLAGGGQFGKALEFAARAASFSTGYFGTRAWMGAWARRSGRV
jgi:sugar/nucleoside kinase (ribokinase family)